MSYASHATSEFFVSLYNDNLATSTTAVSATFIFGQLVKLLDAELLSCFFVWVQSDCFFTFTKLYQLTNLY